MYLAYMQPPRDPVTRVAIGFVAAAVVILTLVLASGCHRTALVPPTSPPVQRVEITAWPQMSHATVDCYIPGLPEAPTEPEWPTAAADYDRRVYVHRRDYSALISYVHDLGEWAGTVSTCLEQLKVRVQETP